MILFVNYEDFYEDQVVNLENNLWKSDKAKEYFEWKILNETFKNYKNTFLCLDSENNKVIGVRNFIIYDLNVENVKYKIILPTDAIIDSNYKGKGLYKKLNNFALEKIKEKNKNEKYVFVSYSSIDKTTNLYKKSGFEYYTIKNTYFKYKLFRKKYNNENLKRYFSNSNKIIEIKLKNKKDIFDIDFIKKFYNWKFKNPRACYEIYSYKNTYIIIHKKNNNDLTCNIIDYEYDNEKDFKFLLKKITKNVNYKVMKCIFYKNKKDKKFFIKNLFFNSNFMKKIFNKPILPLLILKNKVSDSELNILISNMKSIYSDEF